jgi:hypothetical protein
MIRASFLKDWLKIRWVWLGMLALHLGMLGYLFLDMRHQFQVEHSEMIWYWAFELRRLLYDQVRFLPLATGIVIAAAQFGPEMIGGRFRLSLHLPVRNDVLVLASVGFGALMGGLTALLDAVGLYWIVSLWFPQEAAVSAVLTALPWFLGGWVAYFATALVLLEPTPIRRLIWLGIGAGFLGLLFGHRGYQEYDRIMPILMLAAAFFVPAVILPAHRYRHGS